jgi:biotin carboxyl carrier protein
MEYKFIHLNKIYRVKVEKVDEGFQVSIDGKDYNVVQYSRNDNRVSFILNNRRNNIYYAEDKDMIYLASGGDHYSFTLERGSSLKNKRIDIQQADSVSSPMPGLLVKIMVTVGDEVKQGATLAIVEAMKMQNELRAPRDGTIEQINNKEGDQVEALKPIVEMEPLKNE